MTIDDLDEMCKALGLVTWRVIQEAELSPRPASVTDLSELRARLEAGEDAGKYAALDPGYSPEDEHDPHTP